MEFEKFYRTLSNWGGTCEDARQLYDKLDIENSNRQEIKKIMYAYFVGRGGLASRLKKVLDKDLRRSDRGSE